MATQNSRSAQVTFLGVERFDRNDPSDRVGLQQIVFHGWVGECVQKYSGPAAHQLQAEGLVSRIAGIDPRSPTGERVFQVDEAFRNVDRSVPLAWLDARGYLEDTIHVVSTSSPAHAEIAKRLLATGWPIRVASEKPLTLRSAEAQALRSYQNLYPISHQLAKAQFRQFIQDCRAGLIPLEQIRGLDFFLLEEVGVTRGRAVDNVFHDMHWHGFEAAVVIIATMIGPLEGFRVVIEKVVAAKYQNEPSRFAPAADPTLGAIQGRILCWRPAHSQRASHEIALRILAGKGAGRLDKRFVVKDQNGRELRSIGLVDSPPWAAHYYLLRELVTQRLPDMLTTVEQAVGVVELCEQSVQAAVDGGTYLFGSLPLLLD